MAGPRSAKPRGVPKSGLTMVDPMESNSSGSGSWWSGLKSSLMGGGSSTVGRGDSNDGAGAQGAHTKGLYMYGGVGCGKTMLMDIFVNSAPPEFQVGVGLCLMVSSPKPVLDIL